MLACAVLGWTSPLLVTILAGARLVPMAAVGVSGDEANHNVAVTALVLHVLGAALWLGGLLLLVVVTGFCGGLTTFSTWMVETVQLADRRRMRTAIANVAITLVAGVALAALGLWLGALVVA